MENSLFAENTPWAIAISLATTGLLVWRLKAAGFRALSWQALGIAAGVFWGALAWLLIAFSWDFYYQFFAPAWYRWGAPLEAVFLYAALGLFLRWAAGKLPGNPVLWFCLLGGLESIPEHAIGIFRFGILEIPALQGSSPGSIFLFAFFEYTVYWGIVLGLAAVLDRWLRVKDGFRDPKQKRR